MNTETLKNLSKLFMQMNVLYDQHEASPKDSNVKDEYQKAKNSFEIEYNRHKDEIKVNDNKESIISELALEVIIPKGTKFYHVTDKKHLESIASKGIKLDHESRFSDGKALGDGLYLSEGEPAYFEDDKALIEFEVVEDIKGKASIPLGDFNQKSEWKGILDEDQYNKSWNTAFADCNFIQHLGLPPAKTEVVLRNPNNKLRINSVAENAELDWNGKVDQSKMIRLEDWLTKNNINLAPQWETQRETQRETIEENKVFIKETILKSTDILSNPINKYFLTNDLIESLKNIDTKALLESVDKNNDFNDIMELYDKAKAIQQVIDTVNNKSTLRLVVDFLIECIKGIGESEQSILLKKMVDNMQSWEVSR